MIYGQDGWERGQKQHFLKKLQLLFFSITRVYGSLSTRWVRDQLFSVLIHFATVSLPATKALKSRAQGNFAQFLRLSDNYIIESCSQQLLGVILHLRFDLKPKKRRVAVRRHLTMVFLVEGRRSKWQRTIWLERKQFNVAFVRCAWIKMWRWNRLKVTEQSL